METKKSFTSTLLIVLVLFSLQLIPADGFAESPKAVETDPTTVNCSEMLATNRSRTVLHRARQYGRDVVDTRGLRLFLKNSEPTRDETKWYGLLRKQQLNVNTGVSKYLQAVASYVPRKLGTALSREQGYTFTPFVGLHNLTFKRPVEFLTEKFGNRKMEPAFFFNFPVVMAVSLAVYFSADAVYQHQLEAHVNYEISEHAQEYDKSIQSDFRYHKIKDAVEKGGMSAENARREAYLISLAYSRYFQSRDAKNTKPTLASDMELLDHFLFSHLKNVITEGVKKAGLTEGYAVPDSSVGPLSDTQKLELFSNNHQRYLKYQIIAEMVGRTPLWEQIRTNPNMQEIVNSILDDPFSTQMHELRDSGRITDSQLKSYLQEDVYWQNRFQDWKTIGVTRLKKIDGIYIDQALTLTDVRQEMLVEIATSGPK